ncbi:MAG: MmgE/PrpD family protein [Planctomycetes bacterium]|nr:MmgE/PrpD family protein [Planctomycetota bacterium]
MPPTTLETLAAWAARLRFADLPARVVEKARWQQASVLAASFAGLNDPAAKKVLAVARRHRTPGRDGALCLVGGFRTDRLTAVLANAAVSCTFDYDEILLLGHPGHSSVIVPLVFAEQRGRPWSEVVAAQVAANELAGRLGLSTFLGPQNGQMLPYIHCVGAAVAAGRFLGLDEGRMAHALAIALTQPPAPLWPGFLGPIEAKILTAAQGAAVGVHAAELAAEGFTGALDLLDHPRGFFHRFSFVPFPRALTGLGRAWLTDTLQVKQHAACWFYQAALDATAAAASSFARERGRPLEADAIERVTCRVSFLADSVNSMEGDRPRGEALTANEVNFSLPAALAVLLLRSRLVPDDLEAGSLAAMEARVRKLAARVRVVHDLELTGRIFSALDRVLDVPALMGTATPMDLALGVRAAKHEFPRAGALAPLQIAAGLARAPGALFRLLEGRRRSYDLGEHDVASLVLPIPGGVEIELAGGVRVAAERDVEAGALSLPGAAALAREKLRSACERPLGAAGAERVASAVEGARPDTPVAELLRALGPEA